VTDTDDRQHADLLAALNTEYFVLQGASGASLGEASSRSSLYLTSLSSTLVALGFMLGAAEQAFLPFAGASLAVVFILGWFTVTRLVDTNVANIRALRGMVRIRHFYAQLHPSAVTYFSGTGDDAADATAMLAVRNINTSYFGTMASMIGAVNSVVGGSGVALFTAVAGVQQEVAFVLGVVTAAALFIGVIIIQRRRFTREFPAT
jgi:hypothetical protein